jgi:hypothetical protein
VWIGELITLVNIALGNAQPSACAHGVPDGVAVDIALLVQAVNNTLNGRGAQRSLVPCNGTQQREAGPQAVPPLLYT